METGAGVEAAAVIGGSVVTAEAGMGARVIEIDAASKGSMTFEWTDDSDTISPTSIAFVR